MDNRKERVLFKNNRITKALDGNRN